LEKEKDITIFAVSWPVTDAGQMPSCCLGFHFKGSARFWMIVLLFFFFSHVVVTHLQFSFFSAAQGLIRLIVLPVSKAD